MRSMVEGASEMQRSLPSKTRLASRPVPLPPPFGWSPFPAIAGQEIAAVLDFADSVTGNLHVQPIRFAKRQVVRQVCVRGARAHRARACGRRKSGAGLLRLVRLVRRLARRLAEFSIARRA